MLQIFSNIPASNEVPVRTIVCGLISEVIPTKHIPQIRLENNTNKYYLNGLSSMTLEYLNNPN